MFFSDREGSWRPVHGCVVAAAFGFHVGEPLAVNPEGVVTDAGGVYRLGAFASNELPDACSGATHVATAIQMDTWHVTTTVTTLLGQSQRTIAASDGKSPTAALVAPVDRPRISRVATSTHVTSQLAGDWVLGTNQTAPLCTLPCDAWVMPNEAIARDRSSASEVKLPNESSPASLTITTEKERKDPVLGWLALGAGVAGTPFAVMATYLVWSGAGGSSSSTLSGFAQSAEGQLAGMVLMPLLTAATVSLAGWGLWQLVRAPKDVPVAKREARSRLLRCATGMCSF